MADIVDTCCVNLQMTKADKNNNTTTNIDDGMIKEKNLNQYYFYFIFIFRS